VASKGFSQSDIATTLQVDRSVITRDMTHLKHQARENLMIHIQETMPYEYHKSNIPIDQELRMCWAIVDKTMDDKTKLQALALIKEQLNTLKMLDERIEGVDKEIAKVEATSSGVF
jgi:hypothetical protein